MVTTWGWPPCGGREQGKGKAKMKWNYPVYNVHCTLYSLRVLVYELLKEAGEGQGAPLRQPPSSVKGQGKEKRSRTGPTLCTLYSAHCTLYSSSCW